MDNSQVDVVKVDSDLQLNLDRGSTITAADAVSRDKQVHDFGKCEAFDELAKILRTNVDKKNISPELQKLVFDNNNNDENEKNVEFDRKGGVCLDGGTLHEIKEDTTTKKVVNDDWLVSICEANEASGREAKEHGKHFLETCGDRDLERQLTPMQLRDIHTLEDIVSDIQKVEKRSQSQSMSTTTRVKAKVTLGWNTVYEFEFWVMDHTKLPGEEMVPLVKSLSADKDSAEGMHVTGRPTKSLQIPAGEWIEFRKGHPTLVRLTNITDRAVYCPAHLNVIAWVPRGFMPKQAGYVPIDSRKYEQWQVLAYAGSHDEIWFKLECELIDSATDGSLVGDYPVNVAVASGASSPAPTESSDVNQECDNPPTETHSEEKSPDASVTDLEHTFMCVMHVLFTEGNDDPADDDYAVHEANYISLEGYAQELAFLPDLTEPSVPELDYTAPNATMILSGNALPPPAYGVLQKLYELLKGLLKAGLDGFSDSPWTSPIVIVLKKNGQDIRLCIDYKMVNPVTAIMEYATPLDDDLLTELENYLWFCSLDAASGFWAIMMTKRAPEVQRARVFTQLLQSTITNFVDLDDSLALVAPPTKGSPSTRLDPSLLYAQLPHDYEGFVVSFDGTAKTEKNGGYEMIYEPSSDDIKVENASSETFAQILDGKIRYIYAMGSDILLQRNTFADFAHQECAEVSATARSQIKTKKKHVHFED
ncbi:hypothetical protein PHMEG_00023883 [Phytophthora megakarya]|uniref:Reverse transcriptase n=1 Tax=Phytophthora megakarya TaxID=4795 RepID=A0A225VGJ1_9STRA|nr:hypothetical protein PHMEG_00023883 [Phytophthora megakarya]